MRLQLELLKPEMTLAERGIRSTVVMFGGARIPEPGGAAWAAKNEIAEEQPRGKQRTTTRRRANSPGSARSIRPPPATANSSWSPAAGPGVMEAGNRGAADVGAPSIGLNIVLPHEQAPNPYVTPELCFNFHYFAIRKMHFLMRAKAVAVFPGGFGTLDEFFETLTLIQTGRMERVPIILFGKAFWKRAIDLDFLAEQGTITPATRTSSTLSTPPTRPGGSSAASIISARPKRRRDPSLHLETIIIVGIGPEWPGTSCCLGSHSGRGAGHRPNGRAGVEGGRPCGHRRLGAGQCCRASRPAAAISPSRTMARAPIACCRRARRPPARSNFMR